MDLPVTIPLQHPIQRGEETISEITLEEIDFATTIALEELSETDKTEGQKGREATVLTIMGMSGLSREAVLRLKTKDIEAVLEKIMPDGAEDPDAPGKPD